MKTLGKLLINEEKSSVTETKIIPGLPAKWAKDVGEILFTAEDIRQRVIELAKIICEDYKGKEVVCVGLLKGAFVFVADILREFTVPYKLDFMSLSSYGEGTVSSGNVKLKKDLSSNPEGKHILILDDLIDTGNTLSWVKGHLKSKKCASIKIACLLDKKERRAAGNKIEVDYVGFECPDVFVLGYGMDLDEEYRAVPFIFKKKTS